MSTEVRTSMASDRKTPEQRRAVIATAVTLALVAVAVYLTFIFMTGIK